MVLFCEHSIIQSGNVPKQLIGIHFAVNEVPGLEHCVISIIKAHLLVLILDLLIIRPSNIGQVISDHMEFVEFAVSIIKITEPYTDDIKPEEQPDYRNAYKESGSYACNRLLISLLP